MKKSKYRGEQTGTPVAEVIRRTGISEQTF